ncbi:MAG: exosome complex RNA-binding protein Rrp4 [Candidatus Woesearchaeota archaeon]
MGTLYCKNKEIVVPGTVIAEGQEYIPSFGTFKEGNKIINSILGILNIDGNLIKITPLAGTYMPKVGDVIIGKIIDVTIAGWRVDTNSAYSALLSIKEATTNFIPKGTDLTKFYDIGDYILTKIINVTSQKLVDLTMKAPGLRKLPSGSIIKVSPIKVPRIIGKNGSMVNLIKEETNCKIIVGQNGLIWVQGSPKEELIAIKIIKRIEQESHLPGLTEKASSYIKELKKEYKLE